MLQSIIFTSMNIFTAHLGQEKIEENEQWTAAAQFLV